MRILVVEDERIVASDLAATLTELGYAVVGATPTGEDAIVRAEELRPDLILMDIHLEGELDGIQASEEIRKRRDVPIIYLTAHSDTETLRRAKATDPFGYVVKPFKGAELRCAIEIALHKHAIEGRLREREHWLATTLRSIGDGVVATDAGERVTLVNPVAEALTGWPQELALGRSLEEVLPLVTGPGSGSSGQVVDSPVRSAPSGSGA